MGGVALCRFQRIERMAVAILFFIYTILITIILYLDFYQFITYPQMVILV
jgi:hypothetical protein